MQHVHLSTEATITLVSAICMIILALVSIWQGPDRVIRFANVYLQGLRGRRGIGHRRGSDVSVGLDLDLQHMRPAVETEAGRASV